MAKISEILKKRSNGTGSVQDMISESTDKLVNELWNELQPEISKNVTQIMGDEVNRLTKEVKKGDKGDKGDTGPRGLIGAQGEKGERGDRGATGATGPSGKDGADGKDGKDASADISEVIDKINSKEESINQKSIKGLTSLIRSLQKAIQDAKRVVKGGGGGGIAHLHEDLTPQLGGDLDVNGNSIVSVSNGDIAITPNGSGDVILDGLKWPQADGINGQVIKTDGSGQLSFTAAGSGDVTKVGTPVDSQVGVWTGDGTIEGDTNLQFTTSDDTLYVGTGAGTQVIGSQLGVVEAHRDGGNGNLITVSHHHTTPAPGVNAVSSRGTFASPSATQSGDFLYFMGGRGYGTSAYGTNSKALISFKATENHTNSAMGNEITFETTPNSSVTRAEQMQLDDGGLSLTTGNTYQINDVDVLSATTLGSSVVSSSLTSVGTLSSGNVDAAVSAASATTAGKVELATAAETDTGTDATRALTPDGFQASKRNIRWLVFNLVEAGTDCAVATNIGGDFVSPIAGVIQQSDTTPFYLYATNSTAGTTGTMVVDISIGGTSIMTTNKLDFDSTEKTTTTAATPPDLTTTSLSVGDIITIDIDSIHTTAAKGLTVYMAVLES